MRQAEPLRAALVALLVLLGVAFALDRATQQGMVVREREQVALRLDPYANALSIGLNRRTGRLRGLKSFVESAASVRQVDREFPVLAAGLLVGASGVRALELARGGVIRWIYPDTLASPALNHNLLTDERPGVASDIRRAMRTGDVTMIAPLRLLTGSYGLVAVQRINRRDETFPDLAVAVVDVDSLLTVASLLHGVRGLDVAVLDRSGRVIGPSGATRPPDAVSVGVPTPDGDWTVVATPAGGWYAAVANSLFFFRASGVVICLLLAGVVYLMVGRQERLADAVHIRTIALERANAELQREVRERKQAEEALRRNEEQLLHSQKMEAVGTLAGGIAHDFNNVLTAIIGFGGLALDRARELSSSETTAPQVAELREDIEELLRATEHAVLVTNQLLAFSRKQVVQPQAIDPGAVVHGIEALLQRLLGERIRLETRIAPALPRVFADAGQLTQVLVNLAVNARDAMPDGGRLTIEAAIVVVSKETQRSDRGVPDGRYVEFTISDTGCGMTPDVVARIFEPFFTTKGLGKGTGLGLSTVYGIAMRLGGGVLVESEPGRGTSFRVLVPEYSTPAPAQAARAVALPPTTNSETILVVEDEHGVRQLVSRVLSRLGFQVLEAASGEEALSMSGARPEPIHLLLTDLVMTGISGREVAERLKAARPQMRVLFMSGYSEELDRLSAIDDGRATLMTKPFTPDILAKRVREALEGREAARV